MTTEKRALFIAIFVLISSIPIYAGNQKSDEAKLRRQNIGLKDGKIPKRILFVGNSYTYFGKMPKNLKKVMKKNGFKVHIESHVAPACTLQKHYENDKLKKKITDGKWDVVVLQEQSQMPQFDFKTMMQYGEKLGKLIKASGAQPVIFMHWERRGEGATEFENIKKNLTALADKLDCPIVSVGIAWQNVEKEKKKIKLYGKDKSHPSSYGSFLNVACFYSAFTGYELKYRAKLIYPRISSNYGRLIKQIAFKTISKEAEKNGIPKKNENL